MSEPDNYEMVSIYHLNPEDQEQLLQEQRECVFNWCTKDEWPMGVIMSFIWSKGRIWMTAGAGSGSDKIYQLRRPQDVQAYRRSITRVRVGGTLRV